jgi:hypothetical protein
MSRVSRNFPVIYQRLTVALGGSTRHGRDMPDQRKHSLKVDSEAIKEIVKQLKEDGALNDPRGLELDHRTTPLEDHVRAEVRRSIERMDLDVPELPPEYAAQVEARAAALRAALKVDSAAVKAIRKAGLPATARLWQETPNRANALPYKCAAEAFFLMEQFSLKKIAGTEGGPFIMISAMLYEAATGRREADVRRACLFILKNRRRYPRNDPTPPPIPSGRA